MKALAILCGLFFMMCQVLTSAQAQQEDSSTKFNDIFINARFIDYGLEYYVVDSKSSFLENHILFQPIINDKNIVNLEFGIVSSFQEEGNFTTPADLSISYQRNIESGKYGNTGFQGTAVKMELKIPTGRDEYLSGFDSWTIEPLLGTQWLFTNPSWFMSFQARYNYSFAALPGKEPRYSFLRLDYFFGYESNKMWLFLQPDYRYIPSMSSHTLYLTLDGAYKINSKFGVRAILKPRLYGDEFYESLMVIGVYAYL
jgi:hypothetical protein